MTLSTAMLRRLLLFCSLISHLTPEKSWRRQGGTSATKLEGRDCFGWAVGPAGQGPQYPIFTVLMSYKCKWNLKRATMRRMRRRRYRQRHATTLGCTCMLFSVRNALQQINFKTEYDQLKAMLNTLNAFAVNVGQGCRDFAGDGSYLALLLLLAADVELNPGPSDSESENQTIPSNLELAKLITEGFSKSCNAQKQANEKIDKLANNVESKFNELKNANETLSKKVVELERRLDVHEANQRRKNIIVFGAPSNEDVYECLQRLLTEQLKMQKSVMDTVEQAFRIGRSEGKRPIVVKFVSERKRIEVMRQCHLLKGTRITFSDDLTPDERTQRKIVINAQKEAKKLGISAKVRHNGLLIGKDLIDHKILSRPGWAEKYTGNALRRKAVHNDELEVSSDDNNSKSDAPRSKRYKQKQAQQNSEDPVFTDNTSAQGFISAPLIPNPSQMETRHRGRGAKTRSLERSLSDRNNSQ